MSDDVERIYWLMQALKGQPGFAYRANGLFEYWGVPLIDIDVDWHAYHETDPDWQGPPWHKGGTLPSSRIDHLRVCQRVDRWFAARQRTIAGVA